MKLNMRYTVFSPPDSMEPTIATDSRQVTFQLALLRILSGLDVYVFDSNKGSLFEYCQEDSLPAQSTWN